MVEVVMGEYDVSDEMEVSVEKVSDFIRVPESGGWIVTGSHVEDVESSTWTLDDTGRSLTDRKSVDVEQAVRGGNPRHWIQTKYATIIFNCCMYLWSSTQPAKI